MLGLLEIILNKLVIIFGLLKMYTKTGGTLLVLFVSILAITIHEFHDT